MNKRDLDAYGNITISSVEAKNGCIHKLCINDESPIDLVIPPKIKHEQVMRLSGKGNFQPQTGRRGDLYLTILIEGEARTSRIRVNSIQRGGGRQKGMIFAGIGIVLVGALGVASQYAEKNKTIPNLGSSGATPVNRKTSEKTHSPSQTTNTSNAKPSPKVQRHDGNDTSGLTEGSFPFQKNAESFTSYLNSQVKWKDGIRRVFSNVYDCEFQDPGQGPPEGAWFNDQLALCNGYMTAYSPQGVKVCFVQGIEWSQEMLPVLQNSSLRTRYISNCVWN